MAPAKLGKFLKDCIFMHFRREDSCVLKRRPLRGGKPASAQPKHEKCFFSGRRDAVDAGHAEPAPQLGDEASSAGPRQSSAAADSMPGRAHRFVAFGSREISC